MGCFRFGCIYQIHAPKMSALHVHGACSCTVVYLGGSNASGELSAFVRVSRHKTLCIYHLSHCFPLFVFVFCLINIFQVQVQVHQFIFSRYYTLLFSSYTLFRYYANKTWALLDENRNRICRHQTKTHLAAAKAVLIDLNQLTGPREMWLWTSVGNHLYQA